MASTIAPTTPIGRRAKTTKTPKSSAPATKRRGSGASTNGTLTAGDAAFTGGVTPDGGWFQWKIVTTGWTSGCQYTYTSTEILAQLVAIVPSELDDFEPNPTDLLRSLAFNRALYTPSIDDEKVSTATSTIVDDEYQTISINPIFDETRRHLDPIQDELAGTVAATILDEDFSAFVSFPTIGINQNSIDIQDELFSSTIVDDESNIASPLRDIKGVTSLLLEDETAQITIEDESSVSSPLRDVKNVPSLSAEDESSQILIIDESRISYPQRDVKSVPSLNAEDESSQILIVDESSVLRRCEMSRAFHL